MKNVSNGGQVKTPFSALLQHQQRMQSGQPQAGPSATPQQNVLMSRSPMLAHQISAQQQLPQRGSPLAMTSRSPIPSTTPLSANATTPTASRQQQQQQQQAQAQMAAYMSVQSGMPSQQQYSPVHLRVPTRGSGGGGGSSSSGSPMQPQLGVPPGSGAGGPQNVGVGAAQSIIPGQGHGPGGPHGHQEASGTHAPPMNLNMLAQFQHQHMFQYGQMGMSMMNMPMNYGAAGRMPPHTYAWSPGTMNVGGGRGIPAGMGVVSGQVPGMPPGTQQQGQQGQHSQQMGKGMPGR
jgi:hypothetical protein